MSDLLFPNANREEQEEELMDMLDQDILEADIQSDYDSIDKF